MRLGIDIGRPIDFSSIHAVFINEHEKRYGHTMDAPIQILNLRVRGIGTFTRPKLLEISDDDVIELRGIGFSVCFLLHVKGVCHVFSLYDRSKLGNGAVIEGPALIDEGYFGNGNSLESSTIC